MKKLLLAVLVVLFLVVPGATGIPPEQTPPDPSVIVTEETLGFEEAADELGNPVGPQKTRRPTGWNQAARDLEAFTPTLIGPELETAAVAAATASCKNVYVTRTGRNQLGSAIYTFTVKKNFCWSLGNVTSFSVTVTGTGVISTWSYAGLVSSTQSFYAWKSGKPKSGHWTYRQGKFSSGATSQLPYITIYSHGDGSWAYNSGS